MKIRTAASLPGGRGRHALFILGVTVAILVAYGQTVHFEFLGYDDPDYVTRNDHVGMGLAWSGLGWAFTTFHCANWHPLTWLSHMADVSLFGLDAGWHHGVNVILHCCNTILLYATLSGMTGAALQSGIVASLFGLHPLRVESVAWVAERKDLLAGLFFMLVLLSYKRYVDRGGWARYLGTVGLLALGLMAKPMLVTVPFVLILLDVWPLGRTGLAPPADGSEGRRASWTCILREKIPFLVLALASGGITFAAQRSGGSVADLEILPAAARAANALAAYLGYLSKTFFPAALGAYYPHPGDSHPAWKIGSACLLIAAVSALAFRKREDCPWLAVGWLWFLVMLVPVIGLVQVGAQAMADRYTYLPLTGVFIAAAWGSDFVLSRAGFRKALVPLWAVAIAALAVLSWNQAGHWRDTEAVFRRAVAVTDDNWIAHLNLGWAVEQKGRFDEAELHYREVLRLNPGNAFAHNNLGVIRFRQGRYGDAVRHFREAIRLKPDYSQALSNLEKVGRAEPGRLPPPGTELSPSKSGPGPGAGR